MIKKRIFTCLITVCLMATLLPTALAAPAGKTVILEPYTTGDGVLMNAVVTMPAYYGTIELPLEMYDNESGKWVVETKTCDVVGLDSDGYAFSIKINSPIKGVWDEATEITYIPPRAEGGTYFTEEYGLYDNWHAEGDTVYCGSYTGVNDYKVYYNYSGEERYFVTSAPILVLTDEMISHFLKNGTLSSNDPYTYPGLLALLAESDAAPVTGPEKTPASNSKIAYATSSVVLVNGSKMPFQAYNIDGNNYFKLRDLAKVLSGTDKQCEIGYDSAINAITITSGQPYTSVGGELSTSGSIASVSAAPSTATVTLDGTKVSVTAYNIGGNNYFKLRDVAAAVNFGVTYDSTTGTIGIDTTMGYAP